jgi:hypothetical protein
MSDAHEHTPATPPPPGGGEQRAARRIGAAPIILIAIGLLLLLANFGWFRWSDVFRLLSLWPLALIAVGVDMLTQGRYRLPVWIGALVVAVVLWGSNLGATGPWWSIAGVTTTGSTVNVSHALDGAVAGRVALDLGVGRVTVDGNASSGTLVSGTIRTGAGESIEEAVAFDGTLREVRIASRQERIGTIGGPGDQREWNLSLSRVVPIALNVSAGVGEVTLDLGSVQLTGVDYRGGVGESTVRLPAGSYVGDFDFGVGAATITVPSGAAVRVAVSSGLGRVTVRGDLRRDGDVYTSPNYDTASERVTLRVNVGVGAITIDAR